MKSPSKTPIVTGTEGRMQSSMNSTAYHSSLAPILEPYTLCLYKEEVIIVMTSKPQEGSKLSTVMSSVWHLSYSHQIMIARRKDTTGSQKKAGSLVLDLSAASK